jgi:hypothetical protein
MSDKEKTVLVKDYEKYKDAIRIYKEFKKLRETLGKPVEIRINPKKIRENLTSKEFLVLLEEIRGKKH